jgi:hypothetical protein
MAYTVRFPFQLARSITLTGLEAPIIQTGGALSFTLTRQGEWFILKVTDFELETEAEEFVRRAWAGLARVLLQRGIAFSASIAIDKPVMAADPAQAAINLGFASGQLVHGLVEGSIPSIYQTELQIMAITMGAPSVSVGTQAADFLGAFVEGAMAAHSDRLAADERVRTAIDLYSAYWQETSSNGRFLTLVMALEALTIPTKKHQLVVGLLRKWRTEVEALRARAEPNLEEHDALEAISRELLFREESSIRSRVRELVFEAFAPAGTDAARDQAKRAVAAYDVRSALIHEGSIDAGVLAKATTDSREVLHKVLSAKVSAIIGPLAT